MHDSFKLFGFVSFHLRVNVRGGARNEAGAGTSMLELAGPTTARRSLHDLAMPEIQKNLKDSERIPNDT